MSIDVISKMNLIFLNTFLANENNFEVDRSEPITAKFEYLVKDGNFNNIYIRRGIHLKQQQTNRNLGLKYYHLRQSFAKARIRNNKIPEDPFLLIPLFKILDFNGNYVDYKLFNNDEFNCVEAKINRGPRYLAPNRQPEVYKKKFSLTIGNTKYIDLSNSCFSNRNKYFIFKAHDSNCAMVYVGVFIETCSERFLETKFGEIYNHYILQRKSNDEDIVEGNINFDLHLDISDFQNNFPSLNYYIKSLAFINSMLVFALPENIANSSHTTLKIKLLGKKLENGKLEFEIKKYFRRQEVNRLGFKLTPNNYQSLSLDETS